MVSLELHLELHILIGNIDYREIYLTGEEDICPAPEAEGDTTVFPSDVWVIKGRVTDRSGHGIGGVTVSPYDKDLLFDKKLGTCMTDKDGYFIKSYRAEDIPELIDTNPDIYITVIDKEGKEVYNSKEPIKYEAGGIKVLDIKIKTRKR